MGTMGAAGVGAAGGAAVGAGAGAVAATASQAPAGSTPPKNPCQIMKDGVAMYNFGAPGCE